MTVRTPAKDIRELKAVTEESEQKESGASDAEESDDEEEMVSDNESEEADNEFDDSDKEGDDEVNDNDGDDANDDDDDDNDEDDDDDEGNAGWADAFAKVLQQEKPKNKKYLVLSKATKLADKQAKDEATDKKMTFEIDGKGDENDDDDDADVKPELDDEDAKPTDNELELALIARKERSNKLLQLRVKPSAMDRERERAFKRIATKGVVQLFNAVRSQQRDLVHRLEKAGPLDHRRDEVLNNVNKRQFLDMLMGGKRAKSEIVDNPIKDEKDGDGSKPSQWSVLRDDFMTNKKLKHWDEDEGSDDQAVDNNNDIDFDSD